MATDWTKFKLVVDGDKVILKHGTKTVKEMSDENKATLERWLTEA
jgi:hypothetical protein